MFGKKPNSGKRSGNLAQYGLIDIPDFENEDEPMDLSDDDIDLEAELAAIEGAPKKTRPRKPAPVASGNLDAMIAQSLKDVPSDEDTSGDENDPDLLNELKELGIEDEEVIPDQAPSPPPRSSRPAPPPPSLSTESSTISLLQDRILNYTAAEKHAKETGESSRARRFARGLKTLQDLLKHAKAGKPVNDADIPPPVPIKATQPTVTEPPAPETPSAPELPATEPVEEAEPEPPISPEPKEPPPAPPRVESQGLDPARQQGIQIILRRKQEFKAAALSSKNAGDKALALEYLKVVKQFDIVVDAYKNGQEMDLSELPTPEAIAAAFKSQQKGEDVVQNASEPVPTPAPAADVGGGGLIIASSLGEALRQRLAAFQQQEAKAKEDGNASKARRMSRIVKQYQDAIKLHAAGKPIATDELPTPAGHAPFPTDNAHSAISATPSRPAPSPSPSPRPSAKPVLSRHDKQLAYLLLRQKEFKEAALKSKKNGDMEQAKEYLRAAKGFDSVIDAARGGLAVDLKSLPLPPRAKTQIEHTFDMVSAEDCDPPDNASVASINSMTDEDALSKLHQQLASQLKICQTNRDHYREMGNIAEMNRFEHAAVRVKQDLDVVSVAKSLNQSPPKFHYESKQFSVVQCNTDLNENELELTIVRGIAYNVSNPKDIDTYVKFEFPYPQDAPVSDRTPLIKDTNSPVYNTVFQLAIQRNARPCQRVFKRHGIKLEVYSRGGWFSKDTVIGTVIVKLAPLENHVTIHEAFPLMDGRRPAGGSLELKLRVRTPILTQQIEHTTHRWLVIDN
ncbi:coiled-coil and C2 domain-containing protein 1-like isoform X2 [Hyposmocoma kahamanoa]|uniref:coiled-coil and C2 domain-containing protein 1-like isoform X2 n=1 Tax=Hyposmocoma kahamanoa TaxID=1477025 RepID=UPI000E6D99E8|nr:coiled-coil and C2 domain-containing protein 1-like isoform X2 [Hyposmocoma kahamanoa]